MSHELNLVVSPRRDKQTSMRFLKVNHERERDRAVFGTIFITGGLANELQPLCRLRLTDLSRMQVIWGGLVTEAGC